MKTNETMNELIGIFESSLSSEDMVYISLITQLSAKIQSERIKQNLSQKQFAKKLNISQSMVSKLESADYNFSIKNLAKIFSRLNVNIEISFDTNKSLDFQSLKSIDISSYFLSDRQKSDSISFEEAV